MKLVTMILGAALAIGGALFAQTLDRITVKLPAPVVVNGVTIPAGAASIQIIRNSGSVMLNIHSESGANVLALASRAEDEESTAEPRVVLSQKDGVYHLNRISLPDNTALDLLDAQ